MMNVLLATLLLGCLSAVAGGSIEKRAAQCTPHSRDACEAAALALGLSVGGAGSDFEGNWSTKGCYTYKKGTYTGHVYYGKGDGPISNKLTGDIYRPKGYDCATDWECPDGYLPVFGSNDDDHKAALVGVKTSHGCGELCDITKYCQSFQWSQKEAKCLHFPQVKADRPFQRQDFQLCIMDLGTIETTTTTTIESLLKVV